MLSTIWCIQPAFSWNQNQVVLVKKVYFKTNIQTQTDVDIFEVLYFDSLKISWHLRLICGLYTTFYLVLTKKVICFKSFFGQTQERQTCLDCLAYLCWSPDSCVTHWVIFLWMLFSPCVKWQASTRCCLRLLLTQNLLNRSIVIINFPFSLGVCSTLAESCVIG